jgi:D-3-phosphoglycerate dehydrogenase
MEFRLPVPLWEQIFKRINRNAFSSMKKGSILMNTSRGGVVDEIALREALDSGHLAGAGLDVKKTNHALTEESFQ